MKGPCCCGVQCKYTVQCLIQKTHKPLTKSLQLVQQLKQKSNQQFIQSGSTKDFSHLK